MAARPATIAFAFTGAFVRWIAVVAMLLQVALFTDHLGATAVHALGKVPMGERMGFLELCTGEGIVWFDPATGQTSATGAPASASHGSSDCAVCSSASVCSFDTPAATASPIFLTAPIAAPDLVFPDTFGFVEPLARSGQIRAPPLA